MKQVFRIDSNGYYVEDVILEDYETIPSDCVEVVPPTGLYKAQFVNGAWVEGKSQSDILADAKVSKKDDLQNKCDVALAGGFVSSALGVEHNYPSHDKAQSNFNTEMQRFSTDSTYTSCKFFTNDAGFLEHTKDQFFKVFNDGHDFGNAQWDKLFSLFAQVDAAQTQTDLDAITW